MRIPFGNYCKKGKQLLCGNTVIQHSFLQCLGNTAQSAVSANNAYFAIHIRAVINDVILIQRSIEKPAFPVVLSLNNLHDFTAAVLQLFRKYDDGIGFDHNLHEDFVSHVIFTLGKCHHTAVGRFGGVGVDGGDNRVAGPGAFGNGESFFCRTHFPYADDIRMFSKNPFQQKILADIKGRVFMGACQQVNDTVQGTALLISSD